MNSLRTQNTRFESPIYVTQNRSTHIRPTLYIQFFVSENPAIYEVICKTVVESVWPQR